MRPVAGRLRLAAATVVLVLLGCMPGESDHEATFHVFGTEVEVKLRSVSQAHADGAFQVLGPEFRRMHREWHPWERGALADLNRELARGGRAVTTPDLVELARAGRRFERESLGRFNPAIGALVRLWGFHTSDYPITDPPPSDEAIAEVLVQHPEMQSLVIDERSIRSRSVGIRLDFSGLAKGLAVRQACELLAELQIRDAMINAGGDVLVCGHTERPWRVAIRDPAGGVLTTVEITEPLAVFTSGNYHRYGDFDGTRYAHILDPFTGRPVDQIMQATVVHADPLRADAGATALVVAGTGQWRMIAERMGLDQAIVVDADGRVEATMGLNRSSEPGPPGVWKASPEPENSEPLGVNQAGSSGPRSSRPESR